MYMVLLALDAEIQSEVQRALDYFSGNGGDILPFMLPETDASHCVAEKDAEIARLRTALQNLNAEIDAFWNADPAAKYHEGRISPYFERAIINGQIECRAALQEKKP